MIIGPRGTVGCGQGDVAVCRSDPPETIEVELADEAWEVGGFEGVHVVQGEGTRRQDLPLKELLIDDDSLALAVPEDGPFRRVVHQSP